MSQEQGDIDRNTIELPQSIVITPVGNSGTSRSVGESSSVTPRVLRDAIEEIGNYDYDADIASQNRLQAESGAIAAMMMLSPQSNAPLPKLTWDERWPHKGKKPSPITIGTARKLLTAEFAKISCDLDEAGVHGYAWIAETDEAWLKRDDVRVIVPPKKPKRMTEFTLQGVAKHQQQLNDYTRYNHLVQAGKSKLIEWFGKEMFLDLYVDGLLPITTTPKELLAHLEKTYSKSRDRRRYMKEVDEAFYTSYNPNGKVEAYFMKMQDAMRNAELLDRPFSMEQAMAQAVSEFEAHYGTDASKAEAKWDEKDEAEQTWEKFKEYWKDYIHQWETYGEVKKKAKKYANQTVIDTQDQDIATLKDDLDALRMETQSMREANQALVQHFDFHRAYQASSDQSVGTRDDVSAITEYLSSFEKRMTDKINQSMSTPSSTSMTSSGMSSSPSKEERIHTVRNRDPKEYKHLNDGKGKQFNSYCHHCGCNCTHWTRKCFFLSRADRQKYKDADFENTMGGSTKFLDRRGKYQNEFQFDSL